MIDEPPLLCSEQLCVKVTAVAEVDEIFGKSVLPKKKKSIQVNKS